MLLRFFISTKLMCVITMLGEGIELDEMGNT